ncbi:MAG: glycerol-3-phosphate dehydrogenase [Firmicutes bacterium]|nr:glycerol-3-phosphate dehydrogenase [Bacillota bacterium]
MAIIVIVGAGMMGSALTFPARKNGHTVRLVGTPLDGEIIRYARASGEHLTLKRTLPPGVEYFTFDEFGGALRGVDLLICGVSSFGVDWFAESILAGVPEGIPILSVTKGLLHVPGGRLLDYPAFWNGKFPRHCINAIGGPCTSYELADGAQSSVFFCGRDIDVLRKLKDCMETDNYHVGLTTDVFGLECAVALKNAYALGVTLTVGMTETAAGKPQYNPQAALFGQSAREMGKLLSLAGGNPDMLFAGIGDLYVTVFGGRTRLLGTLLGRGVKYTDALKELSGITLESTVIAVRTAAAVKELAAEGKAREADFPLLMHVNALLTEGKTVDIPWKAFLK